MWRENCVNTQRYCKTVAESFYTFKDMLNESCDTGREAEKNTQEVRASDLSQALLAQQLPKYTGEEQN